MKRLLILLLFILMIPTAGGLAQNETPVLPESHTLSGFTYHAQQWNNCGPATLTMAMSFFGYGEGQTRAANWLKPNGEDKNVSPWQMVEYVNTQVPEIPIYAKQRYGGDFDILRKLVYNDFPVIIEAGYDPPRAAQGWMGHYLLIIGYDDAAQTFMTHDSYDGANLAYSFDHIKEHWQHFNYTYIVLFEAHREHELEEVLGDDADELMNILNAFEIARTEAVEDETDSFAWFNMGSMLVELGKITEDPDMYEQAATAFDQARNVGNGLPWRMLWYQFGPYEAYYQVGRYEDMIDLATGIRNDGGGHFVEETFYYAGLAREGLQQTDRAIDNYNAVLQFNPNFTPARERLDALNGA